MNKENNVNKIANVAKEHLSRKYPQHLKVFTDGSVLDNSNCGSGFVIPDLHKTHSFNIGKYKSIFTCELIAILMALNFLITYPRNIFQILFCVDSLSVLQALESISLKQRPELIIEITHLIHFLQMKGTDISFCWIPSHCGLFYNEKADIAAKKGAKNETSTTFLEIPLSVNESHTLLRLEINKEFQNNFQINRPNDVVYNFHIKSLSQLTIFEQRLAYRWKLNSFRTKYNKKVKCICGNNISNQHILQCVNLKRYLISISNEDYNTVFTHNNLLCNFFKELIRCPINSFL